MMHLLFVATPSLAGVSIPLPDARPVVPGETVSVAFATGDGSCTVATGSVQHARDGLANVEVGLLAAATIEWADQQGDVRVAGADESMPACSGLPPIYDVSAPPEGTALRLRHGVRDLRHDQLRSVRTLGPGWVTVFPDPGCVGGCRAELVVVHDDAPPTLFRVATGAQLEESASWELGLPAGGAAPVGRLDADYWALSDDRIAAERLGGRWVLLASGAVRAAGFVRSEDAAPERIRVDATGGWGGTVSEPEVPVRNGRRRWYKLQRPPSEVRLADPSVASVAVKGARIGLEGLRAGRTHLVILDGDDVRLVRVVVVDP